MLWLWEQDSVIGIDDKRKDEAYRKMDVDFIVQFLKKTNLAEAKTDGYDTGNVFFETEANMEEGTLGCMYVTKCGYLYYYLISTHEIYVMKMNPYRKWFETVKDNKKICDYKELKNISTTGPFTTVYHTAGYTIKKDVLAKQPFCKVYKVDCRKYFDKLGEDTLSECNQEIKELKKILN